MGFSELMRDASRRPVGDENKPVTGKEWKAVSKSFRHIEDLKEGDKVKWKKKFSDRRIPAKDEVVAVFRVFPIRPYPQSGSNHDADECDFSVLYSDGEVYSEFCFDSRRFEKVK
jgi:hypothetical protein